MKTNQPVWQFVANLGDANPLAHGGFFVYSDRTGKYAPECVLLEPKEGEDDPRDPGMFWSVRRFSCDACTFQNGVLSDNRFHPTLAAWFADRLEAMADTFGTTSADLIALFTSDKPLDRAEAWRTVGEYFGYDNLDSYPIKLMRKDVFNRYRAECFPWSVRRNAGKRASRALVPSGEVGPFSLPTV